MQDPRPHAARKADGSEDLELERRFEVIFAAIATPRSARPTDQASMLAFLQELHDRLSGR